MENNIWIIEVIAVCALCTLLERALPFLVFKGKRVPEAVEYLGGVLPMAIICTLVVYCLRNLSFGETGLWLPQLAAAAVTALLHLWKGNSFLSIAGGTACCMLLTRLL